jgi:exocyst complex protein 7
MGLAVAVLKVFDDAVQDLSGYLAVTSRLEEALRFLSDNCSIAAQWISDPVEYLGEQSL